jgi:hypothetical protein
VRELFISPRFESVRLFSEELAAARENGKEAVTEIEASR